MTQQLCMAEFRGTAKDGRGSWTIFRGETKVSYTETIYFPASRAQDDLTHYEYRLYASMAAGVLYRNYVAQRCYGKTI